jgi:uncharacterized protein YlxP (DUF503 family)
LVSIQPKRLVAHQELGEEGGNFALPMFVLATEVDLFLPESRSLKAKRSLVKPIVEGARRRYNVAAAEVAHQQLWQRAGLGFVVVSASKHHAEEVLDEVDCFVWSFPQVQVLGSERRWLE